MLIKCIKLIFAVSFIYLIGFCERKIFIPITFSTSFTSNFVESDFITTPIDLKHNTLF